MPRVVEHCGCRFKSLVYCLGEEINLDFTMASQQNRINRSTQFGRRFEMFVDTLPGKLFFSKNSYFHQQATGDPSGDCTSDLQQEQLLLSFLSRWKLVQFAEVCFTHELRALASSSERSVCQVSKSFGTSARWCGVKFSVGKMCVAA